MKKNKVIIFVAIIFFIISIGFLIYPSVSNLINQVFSNSTILNYEKNIESLSETDKRKYLSKAEEYNKQLATGYVKGNEAYSFDASDDYKEILNIDETGQIGAIEIPKINVNLPIYHGTDDKVLEKGSAHLSSSSFPVGGESTHAVISAHTAYPTRKFFDDLDKLEKGDIFYITVLDQKLKYKVIDIYIVNPDDSSKIQIVEGRDLVSLLTCYPYSVNSHRLIVRGERVNDILNNNETVDASNADSIDDNTMLIYFCFMLLILISIIVNRCLIHKREIYNQ